MEVRRIPGCFRRGPQQVFTAVFRTAGPSLLRNYHASNLCCTIAMVKNLGLEIVHQVRPAYVLTSVLGTMKASSEEAQNNEVQPLPLT